MTESGAKKQNFKSYIAEDIDTSELYDKYVPKFHAGELEVARANKVELYVAQKIKAKTKKNKSPPNKKRCGLLIVTNFRLCFIVFDDNNSSTKKVPSYQKNNFLSKYDITLSNMDEIYAYTDKKHKLIVPQQKNASKIDSIRIVCKNFRMLTFDFTENCKVGKGKNIADALLQFAFPTRHNLLFIYHYREKFYKTSQVRTYNNENDWNYELQRCGISAATGAWRVLERKSPESADALPKCFVMPRHLTDEKYFDLSKSFRCSRAAIWVWSAGNGASLLRMADLLPELLNNPKEMMHSNDNLMLEHIRMCVNLVSQPRCIELAKSLPSLQDVQQSYACLRSLCTPISDRELMTQDEKFLTHLDKSCWLLYVSLCLKVANECSRLLIDGDSVVLQEFEGRDMSCVIASLTQVLLDPLSRTIQGFQALIQKEWIALGHPFCDRIGHVYSKQSERSPLFLLFIDCVWQVLQQFPESFEYSETFLTTVWDAVFVPIFDSFQFNCEADRAQAIADEKFDLHSLWDWTDMFGEKEIAMFVNPLYKKPHMTEQEMDNIRKSKLPPSALKLPGMDILPRKQRFSLQPTTAVDTKSKLVKPSDILNRSSEFSLKDGAKGADESGSGDASKYLKPSHYIWDLDIFTQCYYRFMPLLEINHGGFIQIDLFNRMLINNIYKYQKAIETDDFSEIEEKSRESTENGRDEESKENVLNRKQKFPAVNSFFPFSYTDHDEVDHSDLTEFLTYSSMSEGTVLDSELNKVA